MCGRETRAYARNELMRLSNIVIKHQNRLVRRRLRFTLGGERRRLGANHPANPNLTDPGRRDTVVDPISNASPVTPTTCPITGRATTRLDPTRSTRHGRRPERLRRLRIAFGVAPTPDPKFAAVVPGWISGPAVFGRDWKRPSKSASRSTGTRRPGNARPSLCRVGRQVGPDRVSVRTEIGANPRVRAEDLRPESPPTLALRRTVFVPCSIGTSAKRCSNRKKKCRVTPRLEIN